MHILVGETGGWQEINRHFVRTDESPRTAIVTLLLEPSSSYLGKWTGFLSFAGVVLKSGIKS